MTVVNPQTGFAKFTCFDFKRSNPIKAVIKKSDAEVLNAPTLATTLWKLLETVLTDINANIESHLEDQLKQHLEYQDCQSLANKT